MHPVCQLRNDNTFAVAGHSTARAADPVLIGDGLLLRGQDVVQIGARFLYRLHAIESLLHERYVRVRIRCRGVHRIVGREHRLRLAVDRALKGVPGLGLVAREFQFALEAVGCRICYCDNVSIAIAIAFDYLLFKNPDPVNYLTQVTT